MTSAPDARLDRLDRWLGPVLTLLALGWLWLVYTYIPGARFEGEPGPRAFPVLLGLVLAGLGVVMSIQALASAGRESEAATTPSPTLREIRLAAGTFGLLVLYAFLLDKIGFVAATPAVIALAMYGLAGVRRWALPASLAIGITLGCWVIFDALLGTPLPSGSWVVWP
jgi:putative tricarboxylic transport membrane protein